MKLLTRLRVSSASWAAPVAVGMVLLYFFQSFTESFRFIADQPDYAPTVTSYALSGVYPLVYATASCLAAWESGRLKRDGVWQLAPVRNRVRIAVHALLPVLGLAWLMVLLPVTMALVREGVVPTPGSAILPLLAMTVACAHLVIGFLVGLAVPRLFSAPILALVVFYAVAASWSYEPFWLRHVSGQFPNELSFGELPTAVSLIPHILFAGSIAAGGLLLCVPARGLMWRFAMTLAALATATAGTLTAQSMTREWGHTPPLSTGHAAEECTGQAPHICIPEVAGTDVSTIAEQTNDVLEGLRQAGIPVRTPEAITDRLLHGRSDHESTERVWSLPLTETHADGTLPLVLVSQAVDIPCRNVDPVAGRSAVLWAAGAVGADEAYLTWQRDDVQQYPDGEALLEEVIRRVAEARTLPASEQADWYAAETELACQSGGGSR